MSANESKKKKTVCLKLGKNGVYLSKTGSDAKLRRPQHYFILRDTKRLSSTLLTDLHNISRTIFKKQNVRPREESVLQKFIRGFHCTEFEETVSFDVNEASPSISRVNESHCSHTSDKAERTQDEPPKCKVEFVTPEELERHAFTDPGHSETQSGPLIVELSQRSQPNRVITLRNLSTLTKNNKTLVKSERGDCPDSKNSTSYSYPAESKVQSPITSWRFPFTEIEIDYSVTGSVDAKLISRPVKLELEPYDLPESDFRQDKDRCLKKRSEGRQLLSSQLTNTPVLASIPEENMERVDADTLKAAQALYSKRTRTLLHWINPRIPKTRLKHTVSISWHLLPDWQKHIFIHQVEGKSGKLKPTPMVNPQIMDMARFTHSLLASAAAVPALICQSTSKKTKQNMS